ncbi:uncharacterized protein dnajc30a [Scleropages formosus]|uniref:uncharacterized protein dnajc30a n=1 Tax=Scleropages formosus TaxID=113540 RepID=UPI0010FAC13E|nr:uncharacterized protein LOC108928153 [Scleropages formosus]
MSKVGHRCGEKAFRILKIPYKRSLRGREARREKGADPSAAGCDGTEMYRRQFEDFPHSSGASAALMKKLRREAAAQSCETSRALSLPETSARSRSDTVLFPAVSLGATCAEFSYIGQMGGGGGRTEGMMSKVKVGHHDHGVWCHSDLLERLQRQLEVEEKQLENSSFLHTSNMPSFSEMPATYVHIIIMSTGKKVDLLPSNNHGHRISHLRKRSFCTVAMIGRPSNVWERRHDALLSPAEAVSCVRAYSKTSFPDASLYKSKTAYYDILQVSPSATHAQIKTAYYKQSFMYHPDRNAGSEEATLRFSEISEAYMVLGNRSLKKKYDRGILSQADVQGAGRPSRNEPPASAAADRQTTSRYSPSMGADGKSTFDFDAFYQAHYGQQLQREKELRWRKDQMQKKQVAFKDRELGRMTEISVGLLLVVGVAILFNMKSSK